MQTDNTTLADLSVFTPDDSFSIFEKLNFTITAGGKEWLKNFLKRQLSTVAEIEGVQKIVRAIMQLNTPLIGHINNGTLMVVEKFFSSSVAEIPESPNAVSSRLYKLFASQDYSLLKYSVQHFVRFIKGIHGIVELLTPQHEVEGLKVMIDRMRQLTESELFQFAIDCKNEKEIPPSKLLWAARRIRFRHKSDVYALIELFYQIDAYNSVAIAANKLSLHFPVFTESDKPVLKAENLIHLLLPQPVSYHIELGAEKNFLFLTGANMAGKSTFIKAVGVAVYLAHAGFPVPAKHLTLSLQQGLLTNINTEDNIAKGESYFYNEVQRIKKTIEKISDGTSWFILIDELFKGTNIQDAMKCSLAVIEGIRKIDKAIFIVSTHLYELSESLKTHSNIDFKFFETRVENEKLIFNYQLQNGVSNDRLGYLILKREGVIDLLQKIH